MLHDGAGQAVAFIIIIPADIFPRRHVAVAKGVPPQLITLFKDVNVVDHQLVFGRGVAGIEQAEQSEMTLDPRIRIRALHEPFCRFVGHLAFPNFGLHVAFIQVQPDPIVDIQGKAKTALRQGGPPGWVKDGQIALVFAQHHRALQGADEQRIAGRFRGIRIEAVAVKGHTGGEDEKRSGNLFEINLKYDRLIRIAVIIFFDGVFGRVGQFAGIRILDLRQAVGFCQHNAEHAAIAAGLHEQGAFALFHNRPGQSVRLAVVLPAHLFLQFDIVIVKRVIPQQLPLAKGQHRDEQDDETQ
ncbi:MAG: hypothetical protein BWY83_02482 [bacterium ADurb.Bin478]|nr:MAG: hypothetical protein BWY83_02482 [bacterium ADurb.Bin478]